MTKCEAFSYDNVGYMYSTETAKYDYLFDATDNELDYQIWARSLETFINDYPSKPFNTLMDYIGADPDKLAKFVKLVENNRCFSFDYIDIELNSHWTHPLDGIKILTLSICCIILIIHKNNDLRLLNVALKLRDCIDDCEIDHQLIQLVDDGIKLCLKAHLK